MKKGQPDNPIEAEYLRLKKLPENHGKKLSEVVAIIVASGEFEQLLINAWALSKTQQVRKELRIKIAAPQELTFE